jgi:hypothetical protein
MVLDMFTLLAKTILFLCFFIYFQKVDYPLELDVYEFCSDELKKKLKAPRQVLSLFTIQF